MKFLDYAIIAILAIWLIGAIWFIIRCKKQGRSLCCGSNCSKCGNCSQCRYKLAEAKLKETRKN